MNLRAWSIAPAILVILAVLPFSAMAQRDLIDEIVVPFDVAGRIDRIDAEMLRRLARSDPRIPSALGADAPGEQFVDVKLLHGMGSDYVLDTLVRRGADLVHRRRALSQAESEALLQRVRAAIAVDNPRGVTADHRTMLVVGSALLGVAFYDWALPSAANLHDKEAVAAGMFAAAAGFFGPYFATRGTRVSAGEANLALYGGTRGIAHGILAYHAIRSRRADIIYIDPSGHAFTDRDEGDNESALTASLVGSVVEGIGGFFWARGANLSGSTSHVLTVGGDLGLLWGLGYAELFDGEDDFLDIQTNRPLCIAGLAGAGLGMGFGHFMAARRPYTWGDAEVVRMSSFVGGTTGLAIADLATEDETMLLFGALAGSAAGLVAGDRIVRDVDLTAGQSILVDAGTLAGAALGLGIAYLGFSDRNDESAAYTTAAALGAIGGGSATLLAVRRGAARGDTRHGSLQWQISPHALFASPNAAQNTPAVHLRWTF